MLLIPFFVPASVMTISYCLVAWGKNFQCKEEVRERENKEPSFGFEQGASKG